MTQGKPDTIVERLGGYNPPDRTIDAQRQIAQDIHDALFYIGTLRAQLTARDETIEGLKDMNKRSETMYRTVADERDDLRAQLIARD